MAKTYIQSHCIFIVQETVEFCTFESNTAIQLFVHFQHKIQHNNQITNLTLKLFQKKIIKGEKNGILKMGGRRNNFSFRLSA